MPSIAITINREEWTEIPHSGRDISLIFTNPIYFLIEEGSGNPVQFTPPNATVGISVPFRNQLALTVSPATNERVYIRSKQRSEISGYYII